MAGEFDTLWDLGSDLPYSLTFSWVPTDASLTLGSSSSGEILGYPCAGKAAFGTSAGVIVTYNYEATGGLHLTNTPNVRVMVALDAGGVLRLNGAAQTISSYYQYVGGGSLKLGDTGSIFSIYQFRASGTLRTSGSAVCVQIQFVNAGGVLRTYGAIRARVNVDISQTFTWSISEGVLRTFRVEGTCRPSNHGCPPTQNTNPGCPVGSSTMQFVSNVQAHGVADLCNKLKNKGMLGPIKRVQLWSLPVNKSDWQVGDVKECNKLEDVDFGSFPECLDFTVDDDVTVGMGFGSSVELVDSFVYEASGNLRFNFSASVVSQNYGYEATGGLNLASNAGIESPQYHTYLASGCLSLGSGSYAQGSDFGTLISGMASGITVFDLAIAFGFEESLILTPSSDLIEATCCTDLNLPQILFVRHQLARSEAFSRFLRINDFVLPNFLRLMYSSQRNSWYTNLHYRGNSVIQGTTEAWDIVLEFGCLEENPIIGVPKDVWGFSLSAQSRNLTSSLLQTTKLVLEFDPIQVCNVTGSLQFLFTFDTKSLIVTPDTVKAAVFVDSLGIFAGPSYLRNPVTNFQVSVSSPGTSVGMFDQTVPFQKMLLSSL